MEIITLREGESFIKLSQALKKAAVVDSGAEAKMRIRLGEIAVNGETEDRPGRKLVHGDVVKAGNRTFEIHA